MNRLAFAILATTGFSCMTALADPISPTGDAETDTTNIQTAINDAPGGTVTLASGSYKIIRAITISNGASLVGGGAARGDVILALATQTADQGNQNVIKIVDSSGTVVSNLTVTAKDVTSDRNTCGPNSGISMDSGLVVDCLFTDIKTKNGGIHGGGVNISGGTVRGCTFTRCEAYNTSGNQGAGEAVFMSGGLVENCVMATNCVSYRCNSGPWLHGGTVFMTGGTLRGCLIVDNIAERNGSGVAARGGTVENCTIVGNRQFSAASDAYGVEVSGNNVVLRNNIIWDNTAFDGSVANVRFASTSGYIFECNDTRPLIAGSGNISADPEFVNAANGDYHIGYSYCCDAGSYQDWMANAVDLDGNPRIIHGTIDMGCYEHEEPSGFACRMSLVSDEAPDVSTVTFMCGDAEDTATEAKWVFTRQQDGHILYATGLYGFIDLPAGVWNVSVDIFAGQRSATLEKTGAVVVQYSKVYVNVNGSGEFPYDTVSKGLPSISEALEKLGAKGTLYVAAGSYVISNGIRLVEGACSRIVSLEGPERTVIRLADTGNLNADKNYGLYVANSESYVEGLTFVAGRQGPHYSGSEYNSYGFVKMTAEGAVVTNCVFRDLKLSTEQGTIHSGIGLDISSGTVSDCIFARMNAYTSGGNSQFGGIIKITGGLVDRVRVEECWMAAAACMAAVCSATRLLRVALVITVRRFMSDSLTLWLVDACSTARLRPIPIRSRECRILTSPLEWRHTTITRQAFRWIEDRLRTALSSITGRRTAMPSPTYTTARVPLASAIRLSTTARAMHRSRRRRTTMSLFSRAREFSAGRRKAITRL